MIGGSFKSALAIATRCFSPPDKRNPRSPTKVSYPSLHCSSTNCENCAAFAAFFTSSIVPILDVPSLPNAMLYSMVSLNKTQSCGTIPIRERTERCVTFATLWLLIVMLPCWMSYRR
mmetsp:Transcript_811/g.3140  ORF Transcript_811/g.3140 Transcript_811/m.3140 type:complete len:117 (+) Transcript_811:352-702(+)